jgi:hypothetical protein
VCTSAATPEAADTLLIFLAGMKHSELRSLSTRFIFVCGSEGRYSELVAAVVAMQRRAEIVRFDSAHEDAFYGLLTSAATSG